MRRELGFRVGIGAFAVLLLILVAAIGVELTRQSWLSIKEFGFQFWLTRTWDPVAGNLARFLSSGERSIRRSSRSSSLRQLRSASRCSSPSCARRGCAGPLTFLTELLAAIPSIVYGLWGIFVLAPAVRALETATPEFLRALPLFEGPPLGNGMLAAD
jgi:phosphate transport system permease protein